MLYHIQAYTLLYHYYAYYFSYYFSYYITSDYYFFYYIIITSITVVLYYYFNIQVISDYIRVSHPTDDFQELADGKCCPMLPKMTDKSPAALSQRWDDQASSLYEAMPTYSAEPGLL
jgi:hypothetical protein